MKFDGYHPMINMFYFVSAITCAISFQHPVYVGIALFCAFVYSVKLGGWKIFLLNLSFLLLAFGYAIQYASYEHFGVTVLGVNFIGNQMTLESLVYGCVKGLMMATVGMWSCCIFLLITMDKIVYLFGSISPKLSLYFSMILRLIPRIKDRGKEIEIAREGIGKGMVQGNLWQKFLHLLSVVSILITWTMEHFMETTGAMKSRGYSLKGRTAFSIYCFDNRDRCLVVVFFWCLSLIGIAVLFGETTMYFNPKMILNPISKMSYLFYVVYAFFLLLPLGLQIVGEYRFQYWI